MKKMEFILFSLVSLSFVFGLHAADQLTDWDKMTEPEDQPYPALQLICNDSGVLPRLGENVTDLDCYFLRSSSGITETGFDLDQLSFFPPVDLQGRSASTLDSQINCRQRSDSGSTYFLSRPVSVDCQSPSIGSHPVNTQSLNECTVLSPLFKSSLKDIFYFKCQVPQCGKKFKRQSDFTTHAQRHVDKMLRRKKKTGSKRNQNSTV